MSQRRNDPQRGAASRTSPGLDDIVRRPFIVGILCGVVAQRKIDSSAHLVTCQRFQTAGPGAPTIRRIRSLAASDRISSVASHHRSEHSRRSGWQRGRHVRKVAVRRRMGLKHTHVGNPQIGGQPLRAFGDRDVIDRVAADRVHPPPASGRAEGDDRPEHVVEDPPPLFPQVLPRQLGGRIAERSRQARRECSGRHLAPNAPPLRPRR